MGNVFTAAMSDLFTAKRSASDGGWLPSFFPSLTEAGKKVNQHSSLKISAFYCAVNTLANSLAILPTSVYQKKDNKREPVTSHPAHYLLYREPNQYMTAFMFRFVMAVSLLMRGNAYAIIVRNNGGAIVAMQYVDPDKVTVLKNKDKLFYRIDGKTYNADEIYHVVGFSFNGITGKSILQFAADNLGVTLTTQQFASDSLSDRGIGYGVIETDNSLKPEIKNKISDAFEGRMASKGKFKTPVLDEGFKYKKITLKPEEAKFIEQYAAGVEDIARWFNIPAHKLAIKGEGGYNFLVQMEIDYLQRGVMPLAERFKQELDRKTFTEFERNNGYYIHQNYKKLLQVDPKSRAQFYKDMYYMGAISANEIRELEDMNPRKNGDEYMQLQNLLSEDQLKKELQNNGNE
ncbi:phage portal protein [Zunongwangia profunda]|uniref:phage portal protein n=1 Tax=Zunongwangia profunda TaxID=398743 RepID=UPI00248E3ADA|nr:phage portal protein [Zunongwangia profunda]|tara:strand:- start:13754 stop:14962 length:1209 start_codon:yes stop_codon:yes gene_type:complete